MWVKVAIVKPQLIFTKIYKAEQENNLHVKIHIYSFVSFFDSSESRDQKPKLCLSLLDKIG